MSDMTDAVERFEKVMRKANKTNRKMVLEQSKALLETVSTMIEVVIKIETENMTLTASSMVRLSDVTRRVRDSITTLEQEMEESETKT